ncbi:MAG: hypothetical protein NZ890_01060 [Myxococcota bacterium]|nr:hypothetical protein [Myxococcota bacterium]
MGFVDDLQSGRWGLRLTIPAAWRVHEEHPGRVVFVDAEHRVGWHVAHAPVAFDLRPEHDEVLRRDLDRHARYAFTRQYKDLQLPAEAAARRKPPRTQDPRWPNWTPIIEIERIQVGGADALRVLRRLAYEEALEVVLGSLLVPLQMGLCEITAFHRTAEPGHRELHLVNLALQRYPGRSAEEVTRLLGQAYLDDRAHDEQFPQSAVALVRRALRWLLEEARLVEVSAPMSPPPVGEVELRAADCIITPPPRYLPIATQGLGVPTGMAVLTRGLLDATDNPRVLDVWLLPDVMLTAQGRQDQLLQLARRHANDWEKQGATELEIEVTALPPVGEQLRARSAVRMRIGGEAVHSVTRWLAEPDGRVYRISLGAPSYVPADELEAEADAAMRSFRRLTRPRSNAWLTSDLRLRPAEPRPN